MKLDRRSLLGLMGAGAASPALAQGAATGRVAFLHGVASGDPDTRSAVFWTRITPAEASSGEVAVVLEVARDADFRDIVRRAAGLKASAERDFTVKHDLDGQGLAPGQDYFYRFVAGEVVSPVGRVRTLPEGATPELTLGVVSCQLYPGGLFNAYDALSKLERLDAVVHLGDYIYEYGAAADDYGMTSGAALNRAPQPPHEIVTLADYRTRHAQYKTDPDLQAAHARAPFICVWDDHEVANDTWMTGAENHQPATEGDFATRKAAALRAYYEWMPIREPKAGHAEGGDQPQLRLRRSGQSDDGRDAAAGAGRADDLRRHSQDSRGRAGRRRVRGPAPGAGSRPAGRGAAALGRRDVEPVQGGWPSVADHRQSGGDGAGQGTGHLAHDAG